MARPSHSFRSRKRKNFGPWLMAEALERRVFLTGASTGIVQSLNTTAVTGWVTPADGAMPLSVMVAIDGGTAAAATISSPGVVAKIPVNDSGFTYAMPGLATGSHKVVVTLVDPNTHVNKVLETTTLTIAAPAVTITTLNTTTVAGYAYSAADSGASLSVVITVNGVATTVPANGTIQGLPTTGNAVGREFSFVMPGLHTGNNTVTVAVTDPTTNVTKVVRTSTLVVAAPVVTFTTFNGTTIEGYVTSAANQGAPLSVVIAVNGVATTVAADETEAGLPTKANGHAFLFDVPALNTGNNTVTVDVIDASINVTKRVRTSTLVVGAPTATFTTFNTTAIAGYADSAANLGAPVVVVITVNGVAVQMTANETLANLPATAASTGHAFSYSMPALNAGSNTVTVDVIDPTTGVPKRIRSSVLIVGAATGTVTTFNTSTIAGWALNPLDGAAAVNVVVTIDGTASAPIPANGNVATLTNTYGSAYHGFTYAVPVLGPGTHTVMVTLVDPYTGQTKVLKSGTLINHPPTGGVDIETGTEIAGWATDADASGPVQVQVFVNGVAINEETITANNPRKMAGKTADGFDVTGTAGEFAGKVVQVFAYDSTTNTPVLIWSNNHLPKGAITSATEYNVTGWVADPDDPSTPLTVKLYIDGVLDDTQTANNQDATVQKQAGALNVGFSFEITSLTPGSHVLTVYTEDGQATGLAPVLLGTRTVTNRPPVGAVTTLNSSVVSGWAYDPDAGATPISVSLYVDEELITTVPANVPMTSLVAKTGSADHGFSLDLTQVLPNFPAGSYSVTVTATDTDGSDDADVVIFDGFINNHPPVGKIESVTGTTITGWASDPDTTDPIPVDIYVDGQYSTTVSADQARSDANTGHGFVVNLPTLTFGTHTITAYAAESQGNVSDLIGSMQVTNHRPVGVVEPISGTTLSGWAVDPDEPNDPTQTGDPIKSLTIELYVNGQWAATGNGNQTLSDPDSPSWASEAGYGFTLTVPTLAVGTNELDVYAVDANNGKISLIGTEMVVVPAPE